jgi:hypothetical protein
MMQQKGVFMNHCCHGKAVSITYFCACVRACVRVCVCVCVKDRERERALKCLHAQAYPSCNAYVPYCNVIYDPSSSTTFFNVQQKGV